MGFLISAATAILQNDMVSSAMAYVNAETQRYELVKVVHAYTRSDPTRGQDFLVTLQLRDIVK